MQQKLNKNKAAFWGAAAPSRAEYIIAGIILAVLFFAFMHDDILETANHTWLLLDDTFSGNFMQFYTRTLAHTENTLYYVNAAHYNILVYVLFAVWLLPVYVICHIAAITPAPLFLAMWAKVLCAAFAVGCAYLTYRLALVLGMETGDAKWSGLMFMLSPFTLFAAFCMGQYDALCLFFTLLALCFYFKRRYYAFAFIMGAAIVCKFFALFLLIPLLLLTQKRIVNLLKYLVISLWAYIPTALLFRGRDGDMGVFNKLIAERLFTSSINGGAAAIPIFLVLYCVICAVCRFYHPEDEKAVQNASLYVCLAVYSSLFLFVLWHPQWLILLVPFTVLTTMRAKNKLPWWVIDVIFFAGFMLLSYNIFNGQLEFNLIKASPLGALFGLTGLEGAQTLSFYASLLPFSAQLASVLFAAPLVLNMALKLPLKNGIAADRLAGNAHFTPSPRAAVWGTAILGFGCVFLLPCMFQIIKCLM